ncbi:hypothetical protein P4V86_03345 [Brevibacillus laterosporus]|uniref:hypothetical protein n=1 Tax=Brevibacillus laterosporus TaxID=1465 RepID=UPI0003802763|nr:hypothetical protein [Brevibacillus laterosporus]MED2002393.1 hypothetical protein [Brevibacillus laterosporus]
MNCPRCEHELIWGGDFSFEDYGREGDGIVSNLSCPCGVYVEVSIPNEREDEENANSNLR